MIARDWRRAGGRRPNGGFVCSAAVLPERFVLRGGAPYSGNYSAGSGDAMWRFQPHKYKDHYACFECRKAFRISPFREWLPPEVHFGR